MYSRLTETILKQCGLIDENSTALIKTPTTAITPEFDVNQLASHQPPFVTWKRAARDAKKKIIITDWSHQFSENADNSLYLRLLEDGFEIYVWTGKLTPIKSANDLFRALSQVEPIHPENLAQAASKQGIEAQSLKILDYFESRRCHQIITGEKQDESPVLKWEDLRAIRSETVRQSILESFPENQPFSIRVDKLHLDEDNIGFFEDLLSLPAIEGFIHHNPKMIVPDQSIFKEFEAILKKNAPKFRFLEIELSRDECYLSSIFSECHRLESLILKKCDYQELDLPSPERLRKLHIEIPSRLDNVAEKLVPRCSLLEELSLELILPRSTVEKFPASLKRLAIYGEQEFFFLFDKFPLLEELSFTGSGANPVKLPSNSIERKNLHSLTVLGCMFTPEHSSHLQTQFSSVKSLTLVNVAGWPTSVSFPQLRKLSLNGIDCATSLLLLHPQIVTLTLSSCGSIPFTQITLEHVKYFTVCLDNSEEAEIFKCCESVEELNLIIADDNIEIFTDATLPRLRKLMLDAPSSVEIPFPPLYRLISESPLLEEFVSRPLLKDIEFIDSSEPIKSKQLQKLRLSTRRDLPVAMFFEKFNLNNRSTLHDINLIRLNNNDLDRNYSFCLHNLCLIVTGSFGEPTVSSQISISTSLPVWKISLRDIAGSPFTFAFGKFREVGYQLLDHYLPSDDVITKRREHDDKIHSLTLNIEELDQSFGYIEKLTQLRVVKFSNSSEHEKPAGFHRKKIREIRELMKRFPQITFKYAIDTPSKRKTASAFSTYAERALSNNTGSKTINLSATEYFLQKKDGTPSPSYYRLSIGDANKAGDPRAEITLLTKSSVSLVEKLKSRNKDSIPSQPVLSNMSSGDLQRYYENSLMDTEDLYFGKITLVGSKDDWFPLPSLSVKDHIIALSAKPSIKIGYLPRSKRYFVATNSAKPVEVNISFIVSAVIRIDTPSNTQFTTPVDEKYFTLLRSMQMAERGLGTPHPELLKELRAMNPLKAINVLVQFCRGFQLGELPVSAEPNDFTSILNAVIRERMGVCEHRAEAFYELATFFGIKVEPVRNSLHAFVEVMIGSVKTMICLGGGPATVTLEKFPTITEAEYFSLERKENKS